MMEFVSKFWLLGILVLATAEVTLVRSEGGQIVGASNVSSLDADLSIRQLIDKYGYRGETHRVTTEDGYILEMHRITGPNKNPKADGKPPILLVHALMSSSVDWIITGPQTAFAYLLADEGYDVWMTNMRGNNFSRKHVTYSDRDEKYWRFSWHESGIYDLPSSIDYVLKSTGRQKLIYVGYSMGSTAFWVMASERPEYQSKVSVMFGLAPVAYCTHIRSIFYRLLGRFSGNVEMLMNILGRHEFDPSNAFMKKVTSLVCSEKAWSQPLCTNAIALLAGASPDQLNKTMIPTFLAHAPAGAAVRQFIHYLQIIRDDTFQQYDHGIIGNWNKYKQFRPPLYDLSKIKVPVSLHYASNDRLADPRDVERLYRELGNPIGKFRVPHEVFDHVDFTWGIDSRKLVYDKVVSLMRKYRL